MPQREHRNMSSGENRTTLATFRQHIAEQLREQLRRANECLEQSRSYEAGVVVCDGVRSVLEKFIDTNEAKALVTFMRQARLQTLADQSLAQKEASSAHRDTLQPEAIQLEEAINAMDSLADILRHKNTNQRVLRLKELMENAGQSFVARDVFLSQLFSGTESSTVRHFFGAVNSSLGRVDPTIRLSGFPHGNTDASKNRWVGLVRHK